MYSQTINSVFSWCVNLSFGISNFVENFYDNISIWMLVPISFAITAITIVYIVFFRGTKRCLKSKKMLRQEPTLLKN